MTGTLYVISGPIGDVRDISDKAKEHLASLNTLVCEDTRLASRLLKASGIETQKRLIALFEHNERARVEGVLKLLRAGEDVGLIVSAGTPMISDPGYVLVREAIRQEIPVQVVPGPTALIAALLFSGLPPDKFIFLGFPPRKEGKQVNFFKKYAALDLTLIFYESPRRLVKTLTNLLSLFETWQLAVCREMTKPHEEIIRGLYGEVLSKLQEKEVLGEITVVLSP